MNGRWGTPVRHASWGVRVNRKDAEAAPKQVHTMEREHEWPGRNPIASNNEQDAPTTKPKMKYLLQAAAAAACLRRIRREKIGRRQRKWRTKNNVGGAKRG
jgi:hypothetical protein